MDGEPIRKVWIPEFNDTNEVKYICADHSKTEEFILALFKTKKEMTKDAFRQHLLENDTLGVIIVYTWDGKRYDLINLKKENCEEANRLYKLRQEKNTLENKEGEV